MGVQQGRKALDVIRAVARYFVDVLEIRDYGEELRIKIKSDENGLSGRTPKPNNQ